MNAAAAFYLFGLPVLIAATAWGVVLLNDWNEDRPKRRRPAE